MSVEDDIARVNAVTDALAGPQKVWVLINDDEDGFHVNVYSSEAVARESWKNILASYIDDPAPWQRLIDRGSTYFEPVTDDYWSLHEEPVQTLPFV